MKIPRKITAGLLALAMLMGLCACSSNVGTNDITESGAESDKTHIEETLNLANNADQEGLISKMPQNVDEIISWVKELISSGRPVSYTHLTLPTMAVV